MRPRPGILEFAEEELQLVSPGYTQPGPYRARPWQREIINASMYWDRVYQAGATQVGKSTNVDIPAYYYMRYGINGMVAYTNGKTAEDVFQLRISEMIKSQGDFKNPCLRELWSGRDDDLTMQNLRLKNCIWRIASAQNKNDLASFPAGIVIGSEVAKWEKQRWNPVRMLEGRQGSYEWSKDKKLFLESSPFEEGDYLFKEVFKPGTIILRPHYQCPHCGFWQEWSDYQIRLRDPDAGHTPARISAEKEAAVYYQCAKCKEEITEDQRAAASERVTWAAPEIEIEGFSQKAETIYSDGTIPTRQEGGRRAGYDAVCYNYPRLVDTSYKFWKCLAKFFECKNDPADLKVYENETMARWTRRKAVRVEARYLESKKVDYRQYGPQRCIPDDVLIITYGGDTQDNGFFQSWYGWGYMMSCFLLRHEFVLCPVSEYKDPRDVYLKFREVLYQDPPVWSDGTPADFRFGFQDRGGHRAPDIDFICERMPNLHAYVGLTRIDDKKPLAYKSDSGPFWLGQTERLSEYTGTIIESDDFFLPADVGQDYIMQLPRQYFISKTNLDGGAYRKWIHQDDDHYRDAFNYAYAAAKALNLDKILFDRSQCDLLREKRGLISRPPVAAEQQSQTTVSQAPRAARTGGSYYGRALGGRGR